MGVASEILPIFLLAGVSGVLGHGGMVWPPIWQDGNALPLDEVWNNRIVGNPPMKDPATGKLIDNTKSWLTDQSYTGGHGEYPDGTPFQSWQSWQTNYWKDPPTDLSWQTEEKTDVIVEDYLTGPYLERSAWRYQGPIDYDGYVERFYKDLVVVPENIEPGEYVLSWRWDAATAPQSGSPVPTSKLSSP